jgi:hypothetical protein
MVLVYFMSRLGTTVIGSYEYYVFIYFRDLGWVVSIIYESAE